MHPHLVLRNDEAPNREAPLVGYSQRPGVQQDLAVAAGDVRHLQSENDLRIRVAESTGASRGGKHEARLHYKERC